MRCGKRLKKYMKITEDLDLKKKGKDKGLFRNAIDKLKNLGGENIGEEG